MTGRVESIHIAPQAGDPMRSVESVEAVAGRGLKGDRYYEGAGSWSDNTEVRDIPRDLTLFEAETLEVVARDADLQLAPGDHRRNITTRNVALDHLLDRRFRIGEVVCEAVDLCEPCSYLESLTAPGVLSALVHRGGLNAAIVESGTISVDDEIEPV